MKRIIKGLLPLAAAVLPAVTQADYVAIQSTLGAGNQPAEGAIFAPLVLRQDFTVIDPIKITGLGAFDSGRDGFSNWIEVGIYNASGTLLTNRGMYGTSGGTYLEGSSSYRFFDVDPAGQVTLTAGNYSLVAWGYGEAGDATRETNGNTAIGGAAAPTYSNGNGLISWDMSGSYWNHNAPAITSVGYFDPSHYYHAGSFKFADASGSTGASAVPAPGTLALLAAGGLLFGRRRSRKA